MSTMTEKVFSKPVATKVTAIFDNMAEAMFGGALAKAELSIHKIENGDLGESVKSFKFFINPHTIHVDKEVEFKEHEKNNSTMELKYASTKPVCLNLGEMWFDTYDQRISVREKYIDDLECLLDYKPDSHVLRAVKFVWGEFSMLSKVEQAYIFLPSKLSVDYTLFLPSGMPCRAKVSMCLRQYISPKKEGKLRPKESPDHARVYTVKRGDTLQGIAQFAYDSPNEWRRIASTNKIADPMFLKAGSTLLLPPILR